MRRRRHYELPREYFEISGFLDVLKNNSEATTRLCEPCIQKCDTISSANIKVGKAFVLSPDDMSRFITKDL